MGPGIRPDGTTWTMLNSLRNRLMLGDFPLSPESVKAEVAVPEAVADALPPLQTKVGQGAATGEACAADELQPVPPLEEWVAAVQCTLCTRWRPCSAEEAARLTSSERGFICKTVGFSCAQEQ
eukprot:CAMPEP_0171142352 /NCGR_PEP_ID=MMETSP0766_2-20121228/142268_1 /TAXON_ID=439317 /ORGANISM="Gambierdiscus australes, Strain CAWD 149" /LENGTH=122 /DNA_ID=CAMNT_0011606133 /DNA_START=32 /DNA_END=397 /DNA_ORIENTATION=+